VRVRRRKRKRRRKRNRRGRKRQRHSCLSLYLCKGTRANLLIDLNVRELFDFELCEIRQSDLRCHFGNEDLTEGAATVCVVVTLRETHSVFFFFLLLPLCVSLSLSVSRSPLYLSASLCALPLSVSISLSLSRSLFLSLSLSVFSLLSPRSLLSLYLRDE
jgi:hypothetical protein